MILVTGATGFIGKHLLKQLVATYGKNHILALTSKPVSECAFVLHNNYQFDAHLFSEHGYLSIDTIIHAGAFIPKKSADINNLELCNSNIYNTQKLLHAHLPNLQKFIFLSTVDVYGNADVLSESTDENPVSLYGYSKLYGEKMIESWMKSTEKTIQILRVGHVYGPGEEVYQKIIPVTLNKIVTHQPLQIWGSGIELRSFIYVEDIVNAIIQSISLDEYVGVVNLVSGNSISIRDLVYKLREIAESDVAIETISTDNPGRNLVFDNSKLKQLLLEAETPLEVGLKAEFEYTKMLSLS